MDIKELSNLLYIYYENKCIEYFYNDSNIENKKIYIKLLYKHLYSKNLNFDNLATKILSNPEFNSENLDIFLEKIYLDNNYGITSWGSSFGYKPLNEAGIFLSKLSVNEIETIVLGLINNKSLKIDKSDFKSTLFDSLGYLRMVNNGKYYDYLDMDYIDNLGVDRSSDIYLNSLFNIVKGEDLSENYKSFIDSLSSVKTNNSHNLYLKDKDSFFNSKIKKIMFNSFIQFYNAHASKNLSLFQNRTLTEKAELHSKTLSRNLSLIAEFVFSNEKYYNPYEIIFKEKLLSILDNESKFLSYFSNGKGSKDDIKNLCSSVIYEKLNVSGSGNSFARCEQLVYFRNNDVKYFLGGFNDYLKTNDAYSLFTSSINYSYGISIDSLFQLISNCLNNFNYLYAVEMRVNFDSDKGKKLLYLLGKGSLTDIDYLKYSDGLNEKDNEVYESIKNRTYFDSVLDKNSVKSMYMYIGLSQAKNVNTKNVKKCLYFIKPIIESYADDFINKVLPSYYEQFFVNIEDEQDVYNTVHFNNLVSLSKNKKDNVNIINRICRDTNDFVSTFARGSSRGSSNYKDIASSYLMYIMDNGYFKSFSDGVNKSLEGNKLDGNELLDYLYFERYSLINSSTFKNAKLLPKNSEKLTHFFYNYGLSGKSYLTEEILNEVLEEINLKGSKKSLGNVRKISFDYYNLLNSKMSVDELNNNKVIAENLKNKLINFLKENNSIYKGEIDNNLLILTDMKNRESYILTEYFIIHEQFGRVYFDKFKKLNDKFNYRSPFSASEKNLLPFLNDACKIIKSKNLFNKEEKENDKKRMDRLAYLLNRNKELLFNNGLSFEISNKNNKNLVKIYTNEFSYIFSTNFIYDMNKIEYIYKRKNYNSTIKPLLEEFKMNRKSYNFNNNQLRILISILSESFNLRKVINIENNSIR